MALTSEREAGTEAAGVAPGDAGAESDAIHARDFVDAANGLPIEVDDLIWSFSVGHDWHVHGENTTHVEACLCCLQRKESFDEHAGPGQEHEGCGDLRDREDTQPAAGAAGDAHSAASESESLRGAGGRQAGDKRQEN